MPSRLLPPPLLLAALLALTLGAVAARARAEDGLKPLKEQVLRALEDKDPARRAKAFAPLAEGRDPRLLEVVTEGARKAADLVQRVRARQAQAEQAYEKTINDLQELERLFSERNDQSPKATDAFNKRERKIAKERDAALESLRNLENEYVRTEGLLDLAVAAAARLLANLDPPALEQGLDLLERVWLRSPDPAEAVRFVDAVGGLEAPPARARMRREAGDGTLPPRARAAAVLNLAGTRDETLPEAVLANLQLGKDQFPLVAATLRALQRVHRQGAIEPLIAFLAREDVGRLRTDAHEALQSLTGQTHGPYEDPWKRWWAEAKAGFTMPKDPAERPPAGQAGKGVTFYGIQTFSERILFVLDVSGSMDKPMQKDRPNPDRLSVAKKELLGAIFNVSDGHRFNVLLFNHEVVPWQAGMVVATEDLRRRAKEWIEARAPLGGTNIHDALEAAFRVALQATGEPLVDTVYFLTDGTPTAGKIQDPKRILEEVAEWNRAAHLTLHCVAVGEADVEFLKELARLGNGQFIQR